MDNISQVSRLRSHVSSEKGFTLVELLITIAVAGILGAIAVMNAPGMLDNYRVRGAARQLHSDMQMARLRAIKEGKELMVIFNDASVSYQIQMAGTTVKSVSLSNDYSGIKICNSATVEFNPNGTATTTGVTISRGARALRVRVTSAGTGNVRIESASVCP